ncbi:hypothetical protein [Streptomyces sp. NPDC002738]
MDHPRTLVDIYRDRPLTDEQARRIVALLGLAQPRPKQAPTADDRAAA